VGDVDAIVAVQRRNVVEVGRGLGRVLDDDPDGLEAVQRELPSRVRGQRSRRGSRAGRVGVRRRRRQRPGVVPSDLGAGDDRPGCVAHADHANLDGPCRRGH
jgi:hypothetical protein